MSGKRAVFFIESSAGCTDSTDYMFVIDGADYISCVKYVRIKKLRLWSKRIDKFFPETQVFE